MISDDLHFVEGHYEVNQNKDNKFVPTQMYWRTTQFTDHSMQFLSSSLGGGGSFKIGWF